MAKLFYSLEEAAEKLGKSPDEVRQLIASGQLQEFRDRDKVMLKVEQVNLLAGGGEDDTSIPLTESGDQDAISLSSESGSAFALDTPKEQSGVSVFEADELEAVDPSAQTQISETGTTDFATDAGSSGSGLLDLTREVDDTSLGSDLLEDVYGGEQAPETAAPGGALFETTPGAAAEAGVGVAAPAMIAAEPYDGAWSGIAGGLALGTVLVLALALVVLIGAMTGGFPELITIAGDKQMIVLGSAGGGMLLLAIIGLLIGKRSG